MCAKRRVMWQRLCFPLFTKHRHKKALTARCTRDETIHRLIPPRKQTFRNLPLRADGYCQKFRAQFLGNPADIFFIFVRIKGTGAVNQQAAVFEARPNITQNLPLPLCTKIYILRAPLADSGRVPTEKALSRTRHVRQNNIKQQIRFGKIFWRIMRNQHTRVALFENIFQENIGAAAVNFVTDKHRTGG